MEATATPPRSILAKTASVIMALVLAVAFIPSNAYAASSKSVAKQGFSTSTKVIQKKAATVKVGTTKLTFKKGQGYVKFKAPKTKTYSFTFSNVKDPKKRTSSAFVEVQTVDSAKYSFMTDVSTKGGKTETLWLGANGYKSTKGKVINRNLPSRTGKLKVKKGDWVFFYFYAGTDSKVTANLKVA